MGLEKRIVAMFMMSSTSCEGVVSVCQSLPDRAEGVDRSAGLQRMEVLRPTGGHSPLPGYAVGRKSRILRPWRVNRARSCRDAVR
jgi:hypothetical protein